MLNKLRIMYNSTRPCNFFSYHCVRCTFHLRYIVKCIHTNRELSSGTKIWVECILTTNKMIERHTAHTIVSWSNPKQWIIVHTSDLIMMIRQSIYLLSIITGEMGKTHSPIYCMMDNWENMLNLTHTLDKNISDRHFIKVQCLKISLHNDGNEMV